MTSYLEPLHAVLLAARGHGVGDLVPATVDARRELLHCLLQLLLLLGRPRRRVTSGLRQHRLRRACAGAPTQQLVKFLSVSMCTDQRFSNNNLSVRAIMAVQYSSRDDVH